MGDKTTICIGRDPYCPCQDGDACHYVDMPGSPAMKPKTSLELRDTWQPPETAPMPHRYLTKSMEVNAMSFDPHCLELAELFLPHKAAKRVKDELAQHIQDAIEDFLSVYEEEIPTE